MTQEIEQPAGLSQSGKGTRLRRSNAWSLVFRPECLHALLLFTAITGCASAPVDTESDYPKSFPKVSASSGACPVFAKLYSNHGISYNPANNLEAPAVLSRDVFRLGDLFHNADAIKVSVDAKSLSSNVAQIRALSLATTSGEKWDAPKARLGACAWGMLTYVHYGQGGATPVGLGFVTEGANLYVAVDGSLIVRSSHLVSGTVLVIPFSSRSSVIYYHFPTANSE